MEWRIQKIIGTLLRYCFTHKPQHRKINLIQLLIRENAAYFVYLFIPTNPYVLFSYLVANVEIIYRKGHKTPFPTQQT